MSRGVAAKGIASLVPIDDNAGDAPGGMVTESGGGSAGKAGRPGKRGTDHRGGFLDEGDRRAV
jgi:hypothetical protein